MPIRAELLPLYQTPECKATKARAIERSGNCCERCHVPNGILIARYKTHPGWWFTLEGEVHNETGELQANYWSCEGDPPDAWATIRLGMAHLDHDPRNNSEENTPYLCGRCHIVHDVPKHVANSRETRKGRKDASRPLLEARL